MSALTDKLLKVGVAGTLTQMTSPGKALGASGFNIGSASNYPTDTAFIVAVRVVDNDGVEEDGTYTEWIATISGTALTIDPSPVYGDDQVYAAGANTQVFIPVSAYRDNRLIDALLEVLNQSAELKTDAQVEGRGDLNSFAPAGMLAPYAGGTAPDGWLLCYGQSLLRADYADLFAAIGTTYGAADGTHFSLPDLRGRVIAGQDDMGGSSANRLTNPASTTGGIDGDVLGGTGGAETHVLTTAQLAAHTHGFTVNASNTGSGSVPSVGNNPPQTTGTTNSTGSDAAHNNVQPTIILNYIIKT